MFQEQDAKLNKIMGTLRDLKVDDRSHTGITNDKAHRPVYNAHMRDGRSHADNSQHSRFNARHNVNMTSNRRSHTTNNVCWNCGEFGHFIRDCMQQDRQMDRESGRLPNQTHMRMSSGQTNRQGNYR